MDIVTTLKELIMGNRIRGPRMVSVTGNGETVPEQIEPLNEVDKAIMENQSLVTVAPQNIIKDTNTKYFLITFDDSKQITQVETLSEEEIINKMSVLNIAKALNSLPTINPAYWDGRYAIIKGNFVVPKEVRRIELI